MQAGKEVTIHESPINAHGWSGYGYAITDPETGAGAYIIEGRGNGGVFIHFFAILIMTFLIEALTLFSYGLSSIIIDRSSIALSLGVFAFVKSQDPFHKIYTSLFQLSLSLIFFAMLGSPPVIAIGIMINIGVLFWNLYKYLISAPHHKEINNINFYA